MSQDESHRHPVEALSAFLDQEIGGRERAEIESHLRSCPGCRTILEDLQRLDAAVGAEVVPPAPAGLARRIRSRLGAAGAADLGSIGAGAAAARKPPRNRWSAWFGPLPIAAAASLIVVAALWLRSPSRPPAASPAATADEAQSTARNDAGKDVAPVAPPAAAEPAASPSTANEGMASKSVLQESQSRDAGSKNAPEPRPRTPADSRDQPGVHQDVEADKLARTNKPGGDAAGPVAPAGAAGGPVAAAVQAWPVRIEASPYLVVLMAENEMVVHQADWVCTVSIDPADGRRLALMAGADAALVASTGSTTTAPTAAASTAAAAPAGAPAPSRDGAEKSKAQEAAPAFAAAPPAMPTARALSPAAEAALQLIRERYRAQIEQRCGPLPR